MNDCQISALQILASLLMVLYTVHSYKAWLDDLSTHIVAGLCNIQMTGSGRISVRPLVWCFWLWYDFPVAWLGSPLLLSFLPGTCWSFVETWS